MDSKYTRGEVHALIAPIMGLQFEEIDQVVIIVITPENDMKLKGPSETPHILGQIVEQLFAEAWNPRSTEWDDNGSEV